VPLLYEEAYQWYPAFDQFGEFLKHPNPSDALEWLSKVLQHLTEDCNWPPNRIHLFGFSQGGTVAAELALKWWQLQKSENSDASLRALGSVVTVSGRLLSYPTLPQDARCPTPILFFHRSKDTEIKDDDVKALGKGFATVNDIEISGEGGMPKSRDEWFPIMKFWSDVLGRREMNGAYEVIP
jgi:predicted esterase